MDNKLKALKARNDYLLAIDAANAAVKKYFQEDLPLLVEVKNFLIYIYFYSLNLCIGHKLGCILF